MGARKGWPVVVAVVAFACGGGSPPGQPQTPEPGQPQDPGQVVPPQCVPTTCAAAGAACGSIADGCGRTLSCGGCSTGQTCGGGGVANVCGTGAPASGSLRWMVNPGAAVVSISSDRSGAAAVLSGDSSSRVITRYAASGHILWTRAVGADAADITMDVSGGIFIHGGYENPQVGPRIDRLSPDGRTITNAVPQAGDMTGFTRVAVNPRGDWVYARNTSGYDSTLALHRAGEPVAFLTESDELPLFFLGVALDDPGNLAVVAYARQTFTSGGKTFPQGLVLTKLSPKLEILWVQPLPMALYGIEVATTHQGTVVALAHFTGGGAWGNATFAGGDAVFVAEANGAPRFFRALPPAARDDGWNLAVDPAGKMTLGATMAGCGGAMIEEINLAGQELWTRTLRSDACSVTVTDVGTLAGSALVGGSFSGAVDLGAGPVTSQTGYLVDYAD